jgi:hypothetical protein
MSSIRQRLTRFLATLAHHDLTLIILVMTVVRLLAIVALRPGGYAAETGPDSAYHFQFGRWAAAGAYPFLDYWVEYPPLFPWLTVLAYKIATVMPAWIDQRFWFNLVLHSVVVPFDSGNAVLIYLLSRRLHAPAEALKSAWLYALLFTPFFVTLGWFENLALFGVLFFLWAMLSNRFLAAGLSLALATLVKPYAAVAGAATAIRLLPPPWRPLLAFGGAFLLVVLLGFAPFWLANPDMSQAHVDNLLSRPAWSTPYALLDGLIKHTEFRLIDRFDPALATVPTTPSRLPHSLVTLAFALVYGLVWWRAGRYQHSRALLALAGVTFSLYMLWSKGYSPQWSLYLLALLCILMPNLRGVLLMLVLDALYILEWPVTFIVLEANAGYLVALVTVRTLVLIGLALLFGGLIFARQERDWRRIRLGSMVGSVAAVFAVVALAISALPVYAAQRLQADPMREAVELIQASSTAEQAGILFDRADSYERLAPYLASWPKLAALRMGSAADSWSDQEISQFASQRPELWYVMDFGASGYRETAETINQMLGDSLCPVNRQFAGEALLARYVTAAPSQALNVSAAFGEGITLENAAISETEAAGGGGPLCVELVWSAEQPLGADYTVFVHLLDGNGQLVAQSDLTPGNGYAPTTSWTAGEPVIDRHGLILPLAVAPGRYEVMVGLYEATTGIRLPLLSAEGDALRLTQIEIQP